MRIRDAIPKAARSANRVRRPAALLAGFLALLLMAAGQKDDPAGDPTPAPQARLIRVGLPLTGTDDNQIQRAIRQALTQLPSEPRPVLVLEFSDKDESGGEASDFFRSLALATFLSSAEVGNAARTVAYVPGTVRGHALLPIMACQQLVVAQSTELGAAGIKVDQITDTMRSAYREVASRRGVIPAPVAIAMLDRAETLYRIQTTDSAWRFALQKERDDLERQGLIDKESTIVPAGELALLGSADLRTKYGFASHLADNREALADALKLPNGSLQEDPSLGGKWRGVLVTIDGKLNSTKITRAESGLQKKLRTDDFNLVCVRVSSPGGSPRDSVRLASLLAALDGSEIRTVAVVDGEARGDAALIVMACDDIIMLEDSRLGGPGQDHLSRALLRTIEPTVKQIAQRKGRDWSLAMAMLDNGLVISRYQREGGDEIRYFSKEEYEEEKKSANWKLLSEYDTSRGLTTAQAIEVGLTQRAWRTFDEIKVQYQLDEELEEAEVPWLVHQIERLAEQKWFPRTLLFIAFFALMSEASAPGLGAPGFVSAICFMLFFWTQFLNHSANWLEVLLFVGGVICIGIEIFALPGFGVFGIGGILMVITSIILASQTFVVPLNQYQLEQLPGSVLTVGIAFGGAILGVVAMRKFLPHTPYFNRLILSSPELHLREELHRRESMVAWDHLVGQQGVAQTRLGPAGKARFGELLVDVISEGELIEAGAPVEVLEVTGNRVVVQRGATSP